MDGGVNSSAEWNALARETADRLSGKILLDGKLCAASAEQLIEVIHPGDRSVIGMAPSCGQTDVDAAVTAAHQAFSDWSVL